MNIILLGPPGVGKGTYAVELMKKYKIIQVSTGDILRQARTEGTELGNKAQSYMDAGKLVPDDIIIGVIKERMLKSDCNPGVIFDGFPRTVEQAEALKELFANTGKALDAVFSLQAGDELLLKRLTGRRMCSKCNANFNIYFSPPKKENTCDKCGEKLYQRKDDNEETIKQRLDVYKEQTSPLIEYYKQEGLLKTIDANNNDKATVIKKMIETLD